MSARQRAWAAGLLPIALLILSIQPAEAASPSAGTHAAPVAQNHPLAAVAGNGLKREIFGYATAGSLGDPTIGYPSWNFDLMSTVAFFAIHVNNTGVLVADSNWTVWNSPTLAGLVSTAHAHGVKVVVTIRAGGADLCGALYGAYVTAYQLVPQVQAKGIDGVNIDYEGQLATCPNPNAGGTNYTNQALLTTLAKTMRNQLDAARPGYYLSIASYSGSAAGNDGFFNIPDLNQYVDSFFVMAYDMDASNQGVGPLMCGRFCMAPVSPLANYYWNDSTSMTQYSSVVGAGKVILGLPYYGRAACVSSPTAHATALVYAKGDARNLTAATYTDAAAAISSTDIKPGTYAVHRGDALDPNGQDRWDTWYDNTLGCWREMYWSDSTELGARYNLVNQDNLRGVGVWTLNYGGGAGELWRALRAYFVNCTNASVTPVPGSPQLSGTAVQLTASAANCANPRYEFWIRPPGGAWSIAQPYSANAVYNWNTTHKAAGTYWFSVWARDAGSSGTWGAAPNSYDTYIPIPYDLTTQPCTTLTDSISPLSPSDMATPVTVTANAPGCPNPQYQFWMLSPGSASWRVVQAYSANATLNWNTAGSAIGIYRLSVWVRDSSSLGLLHSSAGSWDMSEDIKYTLTTSPCAAASPSVSATNTSTVGAQVAFTAPATSCPHPSYQFWMLAPGTTTWRIVQPYSTNATFNWSTSGLTAGTYRVTVWVRDASSFGLHSNGLGAWDESENFTQTLASGPPCTATSANFTPPVTAAAGTPVTIDASPTTCPTTAQYQFWMLAPGSTTWQIVQAYSTSSSFAWDTTGKPQGLYRFAIWVRDSASSGTLRNSLGSWDMSSNPTYTIT